MTNYAVQIGPCVIFACVAGALVVNWTEILAEFFAVQVNIALASGNCSSKSK
jgi:hypothetical protein